MTKPICIGHRGAPLQFPEHTKESYEAAARMGAGILECDVTFTKDLALVCRHSQCDLHRTTNILTTPLAQSCRVPYNGDFASVQCCTSDLTLAQFRTLCGRRDIVDTSAATIEGYLAEPPNRMLAEPVACGTLLTHRESIALIDSLGADFTPELKAPQVEMPFAPEFDQTAYADKLIAEYTEAGIAPTRVHPQSFNPDDVLHWIAQHPAFGAQAVFLDPRGRDPDFKPTLAGMQALKQRGLTVLAPPMPMLLARDADGVLRATEYATLAKQAGLKLITWTFEAGDATDPNNWLYANLPGYMDHEARMLEVLHALATQAQVEGVFSDWPGTVTYYANCLNR